MTDAPVATPPGAVPSASASPRSFRDVAEVLTEFVGFYALVFSFNTFGLTFAALDPKYPIATRVIAVLVFLGMTALFYHLGAGLTRRSRAWRIGAIVLLLLLVWLNGTNSANYAPTRIGYVTIDIVLLVAIITTLVPRRHVGRSAP